MASYKATYQPKYGAPHPVTISPARQQAAHLTTGPRLGPRLGNLWQDRIMVALPRNWNDVFH